MIPWDHPGRDLGVSVRTGLINDVVKISYAVIADEMNAKRDAETQQRGQKTVERIGFVLENAIACLRADRA